MKFLVTDDSKLARLGIIKLLNLLEPSAEIFEAENGLEAMELFNKLSPDVVFMDLTMPLMSGYEATQKILEINPKTEIVVITADIQKKAEEKVLALGAKMLIQKPINQEKMHEILMHLHI